MSRGAFSCGEVRAAAGLCLKPSHYRAILEMRPDVAFFEVHAENYMGAGGPPHRFLEAIRTHYPLSVHGVGLSIGSSQPLDREHLARLAGVVERYQPALVSEHLAWSSHDGAYLSDLLPLPYTEETLVLVSEHVDEVQSVLRRPILIENPATYLRYCTSSLAETEFLRELTARTGCGLLLDVTNVLIATRNHGASAADYLAAFPIEEVEEIHLAGHAVETSTDGATARLLIDDHGSAVSADAWELYQHALERRGAIATLIEWDNNVPEWPELLAQAQHAERVLHAYRQRDMEEAHDGAAYVD